MLKKMRAWLGQGFLLIGGPKPQNVDVTEMQVEDTLPEVTVTWSPPWLRPITAGPIEAGSLSPITAGTIEAGAIVDAPVDVPPWLRASQSPGEYVELENFRRTWQSLRVPAIDEPPPPMVLDLGAPPPWDRTFRAVKMPPPSIVLDFPLWDPSLPFADRLHDEEPSLYAVHKVFESAEKRFPGVRRRVMELFGKDLICHLTVGERKIILRAWRRAKKSLRAAQTARPFR